MLLPMREVAAAGLCLLHLVPICIQSSLATHGRLLLLESFSIERSGSCLRLSLWLLRACASCTRTHCTALCTIKQQAAARYVARSPPLYASHCRQFQHTYLASSIYYVHTYIVHTGPPVPSFCQAVPNGRRGSRFQTHLYLVVSYTNVKPK